MDWSDLPEELLGLILSKVFGIDRHNFSLVCWPWNKIASPYNSPYLMFPNRAIYIWKVFQPNFFPSMDFSNINAVIRCSKHGWLLMSSDDEALFFYDPFNNRKIEVPNPPLDFTTISFFNSPTNSDCFIIGIKTVKMCPVHIGVLRHGENKWEIGLIYLPSRIQFKLSLAQSILHDGKLYFLDVRGNVATIDIANMDTNVDRMDEYGYVYTRCLKQRRCRRNIKEHFLVKPKGDDAIFAIFVKNADRKVKVFKLSDKDCFWEPVDDLEDKVFYVSNTSSFGYRTSNKSLANKIFFTKVHCDKVVFYSLDTQQYHSFGGNYSTDNSYSLKRFDLATWMMPTAAPRVSREFLTWCPEEDHTV